MPMLSAGLPGECLTEAHADGRKAMIMGIMAKDPDLAFVCGIIPHDRAASDFAQGGLKSGDDPEARTFAEQVIRDRASEIAEMKDWLKKYAMQPNIAPWVSWERGRFAHLPVLNSIPS
ncbi:DUF305 domain-containing protein [Microvirga sp. 3-52]|uniref:DUF305 domain-containing protein n=1 Tax=Microvirga sp. 3-52 TaxID=2792425 RepID=UPI001ACD3CFB|nr:DUF305 domain-containing protein [Microvirga sp. 3-52]MBO1907967.1 DUF305 domain-containing protein [Microvirga sp. 3-52]MBS7454782.1 DUF305 domain-containing protein [Microvirga sp. 3-52]